eukprot:3970402-Prymnesium_polylepis.1
MEPSGERRRRTTRHNHLCAAHAQQQRSHELKPCAVASSVHARRVMSARTQPTHARRNYLPKPLLLKVRAQHETYTPATARATRTQEPRTAILHRRALDHG